GTIQTRGATRNFYDNIYLQGDLQLNPPGNNNGYVFQGGQGQILDLGGGTRTLTFDGGTAGATFSGVIQNGGLIKAGTGTFVFSPTTSNTYGGGTVVNAGTLVLNYSNNTNNVGTISGPLTINPGATVRVTVIKGLGFANVQPGGVTTITDNGGLLDYT